ncbi:MAG: GNAT family N-acetyltransferase [Alphaproteobacteria bacterium]|jgi:hypothetical protein|nr:GNAT family N-acetyltransferase [Alphaproteobacteria bacterium]
MTASPHIPVDVEFDTASRSDWDRLMAMAARPAFEQSWAYGQGIATAPAMAARRAVIRLGDEPFGGEPVALVQGFTRSLGGVLQLTQILRGPVMLRDDLPAAAHGAVLRATRNAFRRDWREVLLWMPELAAAPESQALMRATGARRVMTGYSSSWIDLGAGEDELRHKLHGKWRNALVRAEDAGLRVRSATGGRELDELLDRYAGLKRTRRFSGPSAALIRAAAEGATRRGDFLVLEAGPPRAPRAAILLVRHGNAATYVIGWADDEGRQRGAGNLLLWRGLVALKQQGVGWLDLGGFNTDKMAGIARFKLGLGGAPYTLAGTFL